MGNKGKKKNRIWLYIILNITLMLGCLILTAFFAHLFIYTSWLTAQPVGNDNPEILAYRQNIAGYCAFLTLEHLLLTIFFGYLGFKK